MMVIFEKHKNIPALSIKNPGLILEYKQEDALKFVNRIMIGHQTTGKHVLLSNQKDWTTTALCSSQCTNAYDSNIINNKSDVSYILGIHVFTRYLGTKASINVHYRRNGTK